MKIGILKEHQDGEKRVSISPNIAKQLINKGFEILVEQDAGINSSYKNSDYTDINATIENKETVFKDAQILVKINPFNEDDLKFVLS